MDCDKIQKYLAEHGLDGWLMADFHGRNSVALEMLDLNGMLTRRSFYFIPAVGLPTGIVHAIERDRFLNVPGKIETYSDYRQLEQLLAPVLSGLRTVAMEYSPMGRLPYIGLVDAGTVELVRSFGPEVVSSADLVAYFQARLSPEQIALHRTAAGNLMDTKNRIFDFIARRLKDDKPVTEHDVKEFILSQFAELDMETEYEPICAVDSHAGNPHYEPQAATPVPIRRGQLILVDFWAKMKHAHAVYADITWMAYAGAPSEVPQKYRELFGIVARARDAAVEFLQKNTPLRPVYGSEVDDVSRKVINDAGYGRYFTHRTGHSITTAGHGAGPNIDNLETEDRRRLRPGHLFSIEPGIYLPDCGFRTEINVLFGDTGCEVTTLPLQSEIAALF